MRPAPVTPLSRLLALALPALLASPASAMDTVTFRDAPPGFNRLGARVVTATGRILVRDSAGGMLLEADDGARYIVPGADVMSVESDDRPFKPIDVETLGERMLEELPKGFKVHTTEHYAIAYDTTREYAEWASSLLEGLHRVLLAYWRKQGFDLEEPELPLGVVIHRSASDYKNAARGELGQIGSAVGYYSMRSNRVRMYDLTGSEELRSSNARNGRRGSRKQITQMLGMPAAEPLVATVVHEATHQVAFNTGLMQRYADLPLWLVEGMAVYFEAPNARSNRGWRGVGKVNRRRLETFQRNLPRWRESSLTSLIESDNKLRDPRTAADAYADAWALNYFLIKRRPDEYVSYVGEMSDRKALEGPPREESPQEAQERRLKEFVKHFGPIEKLQIDFLKTMNRL